jgi:membrane protein implicated in regulation of membrane protease activity
MWIVVMQFFGLITLVPVLHSLLLATLYHGLAFVIVIALLLAAWTRIHRIRRQDRTEVRLKYDEVPAAAIYGLNLLK